MWQRSTLGKLLAELGKPDKLSMIWLVGVLRAGQMGFGPFFVSGTESLTVGSLVAIVDQAVAGMGFEPVLTQVSNRGRLVRVFIDRPGGVSVDDCAEVSRHLGRLFAVEGIDYERLEVSSPGLDRPLRGARDYVRFRGSKAEIRMRLPDERGQRKFVGLLGDVGANTLTLLIDGKATELELEDIERAKLVPEI